MEIILRETPKNPIIIQGFPGIGMVGAIAAEFLLNHLKAELIGKVISEESPPLVAVHEGNLIEPYSIYYSKKNNLVIVHSIVSAPGTEWAIAEAMATLANNMEATDIISLEGIGKKEGDDEIKTHYYTRSKGLEKLFKKSNAKPLQEGIIAGHASALLVKIDETPVSCLFAETHTDLPDSKAAAEIIKTLDTILDLKVDCGPLLEIAERFENKIKGIMSEDEKTKDLMSKKQLNYVG